MPYCSILECKNDSGHRNLSKGGVSYHRFPHDPHIKEQWIDATGRKNWMPTKQSTICSTHFEPQYIIMKKSKYRYLGENAVPTLNIVKFHVKLDNEVIRVKEEPSSDSETENSEIENSATSSSNLDVIIVKSDPYDNTDGTEIMHPRVTNNDMRLKYMLRWRDEKISQQRRKIKVLQNRLRKASKRLAIVEGELEQRKIEDDQMGLLRPKYVHKESEKPTKPSKPQNEIEFVRV